MLLFVLIVVVLFLVTVILDREDHDQNYMAYLRNEYPQKYREISRFESRSYELLLKLR